MNFTLCGTYGVLFLLQWFIIFCALFFNIFSSIWVNNWSDDTGIYENGDGMESLLPSANLTDWYTNRAREIETLSGLPRNALSLVTLGQEGGVSGLEPLKCLLVALITLLYEVKVEDMGLIRLEGCSRFQVSNYLMSKVQFFFNSKS